MPAKRARPLLGLGSAGGRLVAKRAGAACGCAVVASAILTRTLPVRTLSTRALGPVLAIEASFAQRQVDADVI